MTKASETRIFITCIILATIAIIVFVYAIVIHFNPSYMASNKSGYGLDSKAVDEIVIKDMPVPLGIIEMKPILEKEGELHFESGKVEKEEILIGDDPAIVYLGKEAISIGLLYLKIEGADESKVKILLVSKDHEVDSDSFRSYGEGYYPLVHGSDEYIFVVMGMQQNNSFSEVFRTSFYAEFDENEPYKYSNVYSQYSCDSDLAKTAYKITYGLDDSDVKALYIKDFINRNFRYSYDVEGAHELVDIDAAYEKSEGRCYHYAALYSSMMKSIGVPTREVRGYLHGDDTKYHAWNEYLNEDNEWVQVDATGLLQESGFMYSKSEFSER